VSDPRARLPALTTLLERPEVIAAANTHGRDRVLAALRRALASARDDLLAAPADDGSASLGPPADDHDARAEAPDRAGSSTPADVPAADEIAARALAEIDREDRRRLRVVINATGVVLHTNLGRAPLSPDAIDAVVAAAGATNLEVDLDTGERGGRTAVVQEALARLTGAEDALVVNNGAAALVLVLSVLAKGREVVISRGELVEIGGSFRLPDIMGTAGVVLREIGTTNRTHLDDYRRAVHEGTGAVLRVHPSNFRVEGFAHRPPSADIGQVAAAAGVPFVHDIGSGLLHQDAEVAADEPTAASALEDGADVVVFSGDKLLGGPQAGVLAGRASAITRCRRDPLTRALRLDKLRTAALEATLRSHERGAEDELPLWAMATAAPQVLRSRAQRIADACGGEVLHTDAVLGGGSAPGHALPSWGVALPGSAEALSRRLRTGQPGVYPRIIDDRVVIDLRSVPDHLDDLLTRAVADAVADHGTDR
jgi:L-seryl-tRNA(Ser) seleniumtransferase